MKFYKNKHSEGKAPAKKTGVRVTYGAFFALALLLAVIPAKTLIPIAFAAAVHEAGHIAVMCLTGSGVASLTFRAGGLELKPRRGFVSYPRESAVNLAGAAANLAVWAADAVFGIFAKGADACLFFAALNMLPISSLDGGNALKCLLLVFLPVEKADTAVSTISAAALFVLWLISVYFLLIAPDNPSLFIMCACVFLSSHCPHS